MDVNILGNFGITVANITPAFPVTGEWYEYFTNDSLTVENVNNPITLQPGEYRLYTTVKLESPKYLLGVNDNMKAVNKLSVSVYPNPSPWEFNFEIKNSSPSAAIISIYDITGKMIRQIRTDISPDAVQSVKWNGISTDGTAVPRGIYFVNVSANMRSTTVKIIKK